MPRTKSNSEKTGRATKQRRDALSIALEHEQQSEAPPSTEPERKSYTETELQEYRDCLQVLITYEASYLTAGKALYQLHHQQLYLRDPDHEFKNFEDCCSFYFGGTQRHARRLMAAWEFAEVVRRWNETPDSKRTGPLVRPEPLPIPPSESVVRLILDTYAGEDERLRQYGLCVAEAERRNVPLTTPVIREVILLDAGGEPAPPAEPQPQRPAEPQPTPEARGEPVDERDEELALSGYRGGIGSLAPPFRLDWAFEGTAPDLVDHLRGRLLPESQEELVGYWLISLFPFAGQGIELFLKRWLPSRVWHDLARHLLAEFPEGVPADDEAGPEVKE